MIRELKNAEQVFVYQRGCYGCGRSAQRYNILQKYISRRFIEPKMTGEPIILPSFQIRRIDYDITWQKEVEEAGVELPAVKIIDIGGKTTWTEYERLEKKIKKSK